VDHPHTSLTDLRIKAGEQGCKGAEEQLNWRSFKQHAAAFFAKLGEKGLTFGI